MIYYYQQLDDIGKQIAIVASSVEITDTVHYRPIDKDYYDSVIEFLREQAMEQAEAVEVEEEEEE